MRARQHLTSRAGNPLATEALAATGEAFFKAEFSPLERSIFFEPRSFDGRVTVEDAFLRGTGGTLLIPYSGREPDANILSRFFAKTGLEVLANRLCKSADFAAVLHDPQLDLLRNWARYGAGVLAWPLHRRRLYSEDHVFADGGYQILHEFALLITDANEWYAVICLFGEEFVINLGGPETEGYEFWLKSHDNSSPLYAENNAHYSLE